MGAPMTPTCREQNKAIGIRVRTRRKLMGMSQKQLAEQIGVAFQQIQKYENGSNQISAARLMQIAAVLDVSPMLLLTGAAESGDMPTCRDLYLNQRLMKLSPARKRAIGALLDAFGEVAE